MNSTERERLIKEMERTLKWLKSVVKDRKGA